MDQRRGRARCRARRGRQLRRRLPRWQPPRHRRAPTAVAPRIRELSAVLKFRKKLVKLVRKSIPIALA